MANRSYSGAFFWNASYPSSSPNLLPYKTKRLLLRNHEEADIDFWFRWFNDVEITKFLTISPPMTREDEEGYFEESHNNLHALPITICDRTTKTPIGSARLELDPLNEFSASIGIVLGESSSHKKRAGKRKHFYIISHWLFGTQTRTNSSSCFYRKQCGNFLL